MSTEQRQGRLSRGPPEAEVQLSPSGEVYRILIVEDDALIAMESEEALREAGYVVVGVAERCQRALELAASHLPHLVIMDVRLAGARDGVETALIIRHSHDIPSLFASAQGEGELAARAEPARHAGWLRKPYLREQLVEAVGRAVHAPSAER